jgi:hemerythrin-like domain-containing protein
MAEREVLLSTLVSQSPAEPRDILVSEHQLIERVLHCLERMADKCATEGVLDRPLAADAIAFFREFVERWHFHWEETYIALVAVRLEGIERDNVGRLRLQEHERCGTHLNAMEEAFHSGAPEDDTAPRRFAAHARAYIEALLKHIENEEDVLFPMLERSPDRRRKQAAAAAFYRERREAMDEPALGRCLAIVNRLADRFGVPRAAPPPKEPEAGG